ncbi:GGDEF domain-containing protein [Candidatus Reidiella endopervernicosa]|nr:GGDEF domain-containing protein [Candidatus Reidiella endopervernicosa]QKQ27678.1 GGDEF domain-containing protein [Candidatus Reidiella endopervernicosa]
MLTNTTMMVDGLVAAAQFKQAIEEDESKAEVYQRLVRVLQESFYLERFSIYEVAASKNRMYTVSVDSDESMDCRWCDPQILIRSETCRARRTGHTIDSIGSPQICNAFHPGEGNENLEHICIPVIQSGTVGSVVQMVIDQEAGADYQQLVPMINVYLREAAPVIEAKRLMDTLRESTMRDAMTGLHNRRFLEEYVETLVSSNARRDSDISILMLDLDYFKKVNDTYGHDAGDTVLKEISKVMKKVVRAADLVIRYGGEEFMILLQETAGEKADEVAEKIRAAVEELKVQLPGNVLQKTISIGVSSFPDDSETFWQAVKYADVALYKAKEQGRNRVVHFKPEMWTDEEDY